MYQGEKSVSVCVCGGQAYKQMDHCELEKNHPFVFGNTHYGPALQCPPTPTPPCPTPPSKLRCIPTYFPVFAV